MRSGLLPVPEMVDVDQEDPAPLTMYSITEHWDPEGAFPWRLLGWRPLISTVFLSSCNYTWLKAEDSFFFFPACTVDACRVTPSVFISFSHCSFFHLAEIATRCGYTRYVLISGEDQMIPPTDWWCKTMAQCSLGQHQEHQGVQLPATKLIKYCSLFFLTQP